MRVLVFAGQAGAAAGTDQEGHRKRRDGYLRQEWKQEGTRDGRTEQGKYRIYHRGQKSRD